MKNAWYYLPWWSIVPIRVRSRVAVRSKRRHGALALSSAARGFVTVARATRFDRAIAGGRVELDSTVARAAFAGFFVLFENQTGEYRASNMARTWAHSSMVSLTISAESGDGVLSPRSRANLKEAFERPTSSRALWVVVESTKMASRGASGKSQLWWCKLETRTSRYESSVAGWASSSCLREATAAQVADGSGRSTGRARARRGGYTAFAAARGGGGGIFDVDYALWGREGGAVRRPALYLVCARADACTASTAECCFIPSASPRMRHS